MTFPRATILAGLFVDIQKYSFASPFGRCLQDHCTVRTSDVKLFHIKTHRMRALPAFLLIKKSYGLL